MEPFASDAGAFLKRDGQSPAIHSINVSVGEIVQNQDISLDIDGVVVELPMLQPIIAKIKYLYLPQTPEGGHKMKWPGLKKHLPLSQINRTVLEEWQHVHGGTLVYPDGGWWLE